MQLLKIAATIKCIASQVFLRLVDLSKVLEIYQLQGSILRVCLFVDNHSPNIKCFTE